MKTIKTMSLQKSEILNFAFNDAKVLSVLRLLSENKLIPNGFKNFQVSKNDIVLIFYVLSSLNFSQCVERLKNKNYKKTTARFFKYFAEYFDLLGDSIYEMKGNILYQDKDKYLESEFNFLKLERVLIGEDIQRIVFKNIMDDENTPETNYIDFAEPGESFLPENLKRFPPWFFMAFILDIITEFKYGKYILNDIETTDKKVESFFSRGLNNHFDIKDFKEFFNVE